MTLSGILPGCILLSCQDPEQIKRDQYFTEGNQLYLTHCANCHQPDGKGLADLYPPVIPSEVSKERFFCVVKNGLSGEIEVNGKKYNRSMPANPKLTDLDIAAIATYVYNAWGEDSTYVRLDRVRESLTECGK